MKTLIAYNFSLMISILFEISEKLLTFCYDSTAAYGRAHFSTIRCYSYLRYFVVLCDLHNLLRHFMNTSFSIRGPYTFSLLFDDVLKLVTLYSREKQDLNMHRILGPYLMFLANNGIHLS